MRGLPLAYVLLAFLGACAPDPRPARVAVAAPAQLAVAIAVLRHVHAATGDRPGPVSAVLRPLRLGAPPDPSRPPPPPPPGFELSGRELLRPVCAAGARFTPHDTLWWHAQGPARPVRLDPARFGPGELVAPAAEAPPGPGHAGGRRNFYHLSQPLFARDSLWAYVRLFHVCDRLCGGGDAYLLAKRRGAWGVGRGLPRNPLERIANHTQDCGHWGQRARFHNQASRSSRKALIRSCVIL